MKLLFSESQKLGLSQLYQAYFPSLRQRGLKWINDQQPRTKGSSTNSFGHWVTLSPFLFLRVFRGFYDFSFIISGNFLPKMINATFQSDLSMFMIVPQQGKCSFSSYSNAIDCMFGVVNIYIKSKELQMHQLFCAYFS